MMYFCIICLLVLPHANGVSVFTPNAVDTTNSPRIKFLKALVEKIDEGNHVFLEVARRQKLPNWPRWKLLDYNYKLPGMAASERFDINEELSKLLIETNHRGTTKPTTKGYWDGSRPRRSALGVLNDARDQFISNPEVLDQFRRKKQTTLSSSSSSHEDLRSPHLNSSSGTTKGMGRGDLKVTKPKRRGLDDFRTHFLSNPEVLEDFRKRSGKDSTSSSSDDSDEDWRRTPYPSKAALRVGTRGMEDVTPFKPHYEFEEDAAAQIPIQHGDGETKQFLPKYAPEKGHLEGRGNFYDRNREQEQQSQLQWEPSNKEMKMSNQNLKIDWKKENEDYVLSKYEDKYKPIRGKPPGNLKKLNRPWEPKDYKLRDKAKVDKTKIERGLRDDYKPKDEYDKPRNDRYNNKPKKYRDQGEDDYSTAKQGRNKLKTDWDKPKKYRNQQDDYDKARKGRDKLNDWNKPKDEGYDDYDVPKKNWDQTLKNNNNNKREDSIKWDENYSDGKDIGQKNWNKKQKDRESNYDKPINRDKPVNNWDKSVNNWDKTVNIRNEPVVNLDKPVNNQDQSVNNWDKPVNNWDKPVVNREKPVNKWDKPVNNWDKPARWKNRHYDAPKYADSRPRRPRKKSGGYHMTDVPWIGKKSVYAGSDK